MADLEEHAFRRDKRFVVRLVLTLALAVLGGSFLYAQLTNRRTGSCAAAAVGGGEASPPTPAPRPP